MQNVIAAVFKNESEGFQAMTQLRQLPPSEQSAIFQMVLVKREESGIRVCDRFDSGINTSDDMLIGGLVGSLVGVLGGPIGVLLMGSYGMLAGSMLDVSDAFSGEALIETVAGKLLEGEVALIALAEEEDESYLDAQLSGFQVEIARFDAAVIADEVDEAVEMEKEMARQARQELRKTKKEDRKKKVDEKRAKLSADFGAFKAKFKKDKEPVTETAE